MKGNRFRNFSIFIGLTIITIGIYPLYFGITRSFEVVELLTDINENLKEFDYRVNCPAEPK